MKKGEGVSEPWTIYGSTVTDLARPLVIERNGDPVVVLIPYEEYQRLKNIEASLMGGQGAAWDELKHVIQRVHGRPSVLSSKAIEEEISAACKEVRDQRRDHKGSH